MRQIRLDLDRGTIDVVGYRADVAKLDAKRLSSTLNLWTSFDLEPDYDYMFVEIHTVGEDDWTTIADANENTSNDTGQSAPR